MENRYDDEIEIDLKELLFELKKRIWMILLAFLAGVVLAVLYSTVVLHPVYTSTSMLYVLSKETTLTSLADLQIGSQLTKDYKVLVASRPVLEGVIEDIGLDTDYKSLVKKVTITNPADTRVLYLSVEDRDPVMAKTIVDKISEKASAYIGEIMEMTPPKIVENGQVAIDKTRPSVKKNALIGGAIGAFLVCAAITLYVILNDTIRTEDDVEKYLGLSTLAVVPNREPKETSKKGKSKHRRKGK